MSNLAFEAKRDRKMAVHVTSG